MTIRGGLVSSLRQHKAGKRTRGGVMCVKDLTRLLQQCVCARHPVRGTPLKRSTSYTYDLSQRHAPPVEIGKYLLCHNREERHTITRHEIVNGCRLAWHHSERPLALLRWLDFYPRGNHHLHGFSEASNYRSEHIYLQQGYSLHSLPTNSRPCKRDDSQTAWTRATPEPWHLKEFRFRVSSPETSRTSLDCL
jgi:hypothetical protein